MSLALHQIGRPSLEGGGPDGGVQTPPTHGLNGSHWGGDFTEEGERNRSNVADIVIWEFG